MHVGGRGGTRDAYPPFLDPGRGAALPVWGSTPRERIDSGMTTIMNWEEITELVTRAINKDQRAFGELVERFQPTVYAVALARLRNPTDAQELTQDVFIHVLRKLPQLRDPQCFAGWL